MIQNLLLLTNHVIIQGSEGCHRVIQQDIEIDEEADRRRLFSQLILDNLQEHRVYFIGSGNVDLFLVGKTQNQDWIGVHTGVTWT